MEKQKVTIKIDYYKETGKWNTGYEEELPESVETWDSHSVVAWIESQRFHIKGAPYTFETNDPNNNSMNKRLVI